MAIPKEPITMEMRYRVEFHNGPISDEDVVNSYEVASAPYAFSVGDFVDPSGWGGKNQLGPDEHYRIIAVEHQLSIYDDSDGKQHGQHNVAISVEAVQR
jgi:hypothetical protein